jgi:hypothetical protein
LIPILWLALFEDELNNIVLTPLVSQQTLV